MEGKAGRIYSGSFINMKVGFWCQDNKFGKRVNASLMGAQHISGQDSDRLSGGGVSAAEDFEAIPAEIIAAASALPTSAAALFG